MEGPNTTAFYRRSFAFSAGALTVERTRIAFLIVAVIVVIGALTAFLLTRGDTAKLPETAAIGVAPTLPEPNNTLFPTVHIAPAKGWHDGGKPKAAGGLEVKAFATGLQ